MVKPRWLSIIAGWTRPFQALAEPHSAARILAALTSGPNFGLRAGRRRNRMSLPGRDEAPASSGARRPGQAKEEGPRASLPSFSAPAIEGRRKAWLSKYRRILEKINWILSIGTSRKQQILGDSPPWTKRNRQRTLTLQDETNVSCAA